MSQTETPGRGTLLEELDARQNEVLDQLEALNVRVEALLKDWTAMQLQDEPLERAA
jgi:hypothetical protein